jgi:predicted ArsR family transcriptional regulator
MTVTDEEILDAMKRAGEPAFITSEIADMVGMSTEGVRNRLQDLESDGMVCSKKPSQRTLIWWPRENHGSEAFC